MTILELKNQIVKNELDNFYIFTGYEIGIMNIYLEQMSNKLSLPITRANSVASVLGLCSGGTLFGSSTGFYVIRDDNDFPKNENAFNKVESIGNNVIVLLYDKIDSRLKFGKHFKDRIIEFEKLTPSVLKSYIQKEISLSDNNIETLMSLCSNSYDICMLEIDKIKHYDRTITPDGCFEELLNCGVIYQPEEISVFNFVEAFCNRNVKSTLNLEETLRENGNSAINLLGTLYNTMKSIMLIQCCSGSNVSDITGLDNRQIYYAKKYLGKYNTEELVSAVKLIIDTIDGIKNGSIEDIYATRYIIANIM